MASGQPVNSASAAPRVAEANRQVSVTSQFVMGRPDRMRALVYRGISRCVNFKNRGKSRARFRLCSRRFASFPGPCGARNRPHGRFRKTRRHTLLTRFARRKLTRQKPTHVGALLFRLASQHRITTADPALQAQLRIEAPQKNSALSGV